MDSENMQDYSVDHPETGKPISITESSYENSSKSQDKGSKSSHTVESTK